MGVKWIYYIETLFCDISSSWTIISEIKGVIFHIDWFTDLKLNKIENNLRYINIST